VLFVYLPLIRVDFSFKVTPASVLFDHLRFDALRQHLRLNHDSLQAACRDTRLECN